jgi:hypothetical protein
MTIEMKDEVLKGLNTKLVCANFAGRDVAEFIGDERPELACLPLCDCVVWWEKNDGGFELEALQAMSPVELNALKWFDQCADCAERA